MKTIQPNIARFLIAGFTLLGTIGLLGILLQSCKKSNGSQITGIDMELLAEGFVSPIQVLSTHHSERRYVIDQIGKVWLIDRNGYKRPTPFLDISSKLVALNPNYDERGLLGIAFHPEFKTNGRVFAYYQLPPRPGGPVPGASWNNLSRISEFRVVPDVFRADPNSEKVILEFDDPQFNHNGGSLAFGSDNYLYISIGDGGGANDVGPGHVNDWYLVNGGGNAQNIEANFLGKILCIDVDSGSPYVVPSTNPFVNKPGKDEIFAFGFRNPYRMSFDMGGEHQLITSDAGQVLWEEINIVRKGANYGWNVREGNHCFNTTDSSKVLSTCPAIDDRGKRLLDPVIEINNWQNPLGGKATTIIGGYVYRGNKINGWNGKYVFGTFSQSPSTANGELFIATPQWSEEPAPWTYEEVTLIGNPDDVGYYLRGLGQDDDGEIYLAVSSMPGLQGTTGKVFKLVQR
ncbi:PQQ-dependent sugar dehydrogenase [Niastella caeni]|uniref:PQQ-dependent sugar dehydrogenase n=1 Tax=Niastella caeni TaxID=2569763 RepID=A0A4S8I2V2_9BACT|nr:PQQ-dependent sugar dehydrogenase [Niastella caeni]THU41084.1 PQQ-dependent sugar dehydrogenase [Niastella caeni]